MPVVTETSENSGGGTLERAEMEQEVDADPLHLPRSDAFAFLASTNVQYETYASAAGFVASDL